MPRTKKHSYAKSRERKNIAQRLARIDDNNNDGRNDIINIDSTPAIRVDNNSDVKNAFDVLQREWVKISACIADITVELDDRCIDKFLKVLTINTSFRPQDPLNYQGIHWYEPVKSDRDIQIIYGGRVGQDDVGHWTCIYYDRSIVHVYDSLRRQLSPKQYEILNRLYPDYSVKYECIQMQPDGVSCGVYACAIATSIALGIDPKTEYYFIDSNGPSKSTYTLRRHLIKVIEQQTLIRFPRIGAASFPLNQQRQNREILGEFIINTGGSEDTTMFDPKSITDKNKLNSRNMPRQPGISQPKTYASVCKSQQGQIVDSILVIPDNAIDGHERQQVLSQTVESRVDSTKRRKKDWWISHKDEISKKRHVDYSINRVIRRNEKKIRYAANSEPKKTEEKIRYAADPENKKNKEKAKYAADPESQTIRKKAKYAADPEGKKFREKAKYAADPESKKFREKAKYAADPESQTIRKKAKYAADPESKKFREKTKYAADPEKKKDSNKKIYSANKERKLQIRNLVVSNNISKKYGRLGNRSNTMKFLGSVEECINALAFKINRESLPKSRIEAELIIKWCMHVRNDSVFNLKKVLANSTRNAEACLLRAAESSDFEHKVVAFCGVSKHTGSSESYFADTAYNELAMDNKSLVTTADGQIANILPVRPSKHLRKSWTCDSKMCVKPDLFTIDKIEYFLKLVRYWNLTNIRKNITQVNVCSVNTFGNKLGHSHSCYANPGVCRSKLLPMQVLSAHFTRIRYFVRLVFQIISLVRKITYIDNALKRSDLEVLNDISIKSARTAEAYQPCIDGVMNLNEDAIISKHQHAFEALTKRSMDTPRLACESCAKLCCRRHVVEISKLRKPLSGVYWTDLKEYVDVTGFICNYCLGNFRDGKLPPTCSLNQLAVTHRPDVVTSLNDYERILIQRAKAFQTVQRMGTVAKKNLPNTVKIQKVKGRTFHLPLPLEETLKKLPSPTDAINLNHELFILVCGIPNKSKVVWSKLVNVQKIHDALAWLKTNNSLYREIKLPVESHSLLDDLVENAEIQVQQESEDSEQCAELKSACNNDQQRIDPPAMLTQIVDSDAYCEQFTIYPIHEDRENKSASALYQLLKVQSVPLNTWDKSLDIDIMCFPDLYPYGVNGQYQKRTIHLRECDFIKCRLMSKHACFRLNHQYLFYLLHDANIRQLRSGIFHKLNVVNPRENFTAASCLEMLSKEQLEGNLTTIFSRLRNTEQYWRRPRNNLACMIRNYGPATWFLTISPSEWMWDDLAEYIRQVNGAEMSSFSTSKLVAADPVSTSRYLDNKFQAMLSFICSSDHPIGEVTHYFWRREYQGRGTQHFHLLIWIKDAPVIGESSADEVARFITKHVTCKMPDKNVSPTLCRRVDTHQRHKHNDYCLRNKKNKKGYSRVCRFGFPRPITNSLVMRDVAISVAGRKQLKSKSRLYDLPRSEAETCINDYNPVILTAWEGNMDMQFVGEKSTLLTWYCTKYTTKSESSNGVDVFDDINSTKSLSSRLWSVAVRSLANRECGALEAADTLLGISLYGTDPDTTIKWLDVNQIRNRMLKSFKTVKALDPESTDIFFPSLIDNYYPNRPEQLESVHLYDFAAWYDVTKIKPVNTSVEIYKLSDGLYLKKRQRAYLINHYQYNVNVQPEKYFYSLLLMFKPWRDTDDLKQDCDSYAESFEKSKSELMTALEYHERLLDIQKGLEFIKEQIENKLVDSADKTSKLSEDSQGGEENPLGFHPVEADVAMQEFNCVEEQLEDVDINQMISELNDDQKRIFDKVTSILQSGNNKEILRQFVSGAGGTGKSFLIKTIRCWTKQILGKVTAVTAPTGLAAFNIDGLTIHRLFQLPIEHGGTPKYKELSDQVLKILRQEMKDVVLIIIDEVSMISNVTLAYIHLRLSEIFNTKNSDEGWFGGKHIILLGDLLQLPPVNDQSAFIKISKDRVHKYLGSLGMINLWSHLFTYDELIINMRQQNDFSYKEILDRVRFGILTEGDLDILQSRQMKFLENSIGDRLRELCDYINKLPLETVCLFSTRHQCEVLNVAMLAKIESEEIELNAEDTVDCMPYLKKKISKLLNNENEDSSRTAGLAKTITIKIGAKVMIRRNIDITSGLVNGTIGRVTSVSKGIDTGQVQSLTIALSSGKEHTIERLSAKFEIMNGAFIFRKQFPLSLSYGITIHKSQGLSLTSAVIDIGNRVFTSGQAYVALSRVTSLQGLHVINLDPCSIKVQQSALVEYNRLRTLYRPELSTIDVAHEPKLKIVDTLWSVYNYNNDNNNAEICDIQPEVASIANRAPAPNIVGMVNNDNVSCYANAVIQCLFHCESIIKLLIKLENEDPLGMLAHSYAKASENLNSLAVREFVDHRFAETVQQDAAEFLMALCQKSKIIRDTIEHKTITTVRCNDCGLTSDNTESNYIVTLPVNIAPGEKCPKSLQDLIDMSFSRWTRIDSICDNCHKMNKLQKTVVASVKEIVVLQLMLFTYQVDRAIKIGDFKLNAIPTTTVLLEGRKFKVSSAIFHHGDNVDSGHYTAMLRSNQSNWSSVSDMQVRKITWPRGGKNAYMFVLKRCP